MDAIFLLRCVDCDAQGLASRLWLRMSVEAGGRRRPVEFHHYVECMNCGAHLKSRRRDRMESVPDEEWQRVVEGAEAASAGRDWPGSGEGEFSSATAVAG